MRRAVLTIMLLTVAPCVFARICQATSVPPTQTRHEVLSRLEALRTEGNNCYAKNANKWRIKELAEQYINILNTESASGVLSARDVDSLTPFANKMLGDYYYLHGDEDSSAYSTSERYFLGCLDYYNSHTSDQEAFHEQYILQMELAQLYYKLKRWDAACLWMGQAYQNAKKYTSLENIDEYLDIKSQYAICLSRIGQYDKALKMLDDVITHYSTTDSERYGEALRKKAKVQMLMEENGGKKAKEAKKLYGQYFNLKRDDALNRFRNMSTRERKAYWTVIRPFVTDCYRIEDADASLLYDVTLFSKTLLLQLDSNGGGEQTLRTTWKDVQRSLAPDACAIEFIQYEKYGRQQMGALVLRSKGNPKFVRLTLPDSVLGFTIFDQTVNECLACVTGNNNDKSYRNILYCDSTGLYEKIWTKELLDAVSGCKDIWFAADGYMHRIAVEYMLPRSMKGVRAHRLTSTYRLVKSPTSSISGAALLIGGVDYFSSESQTLIDNDSMAYRFLNDGRHAFSLLNMSRAEIEGIQDLRNNPLDTVILDSAATEFTFRQLCSRYPLIHISSHGVFCAAAQPISTDLKPYMDDNSMSQSLIAMASSTTCLGDRSFDSRYTDGLMSAREIASMDMSNTDLVVLACCETGLGYITADGVFGIQRGLKNAGVRAIVCSLWEVGDISTDYFMKLFHYYLSQGESIRTAFEHARDGMLDYSVWGRDTLRPLTDIESRFSQDIITDLSEPNYRNAFILIDEI